MEENDGNHLITIDKRNIFKKRIKNKKMMIRNERKEYNSVFDKV